VKKKKLERVEILAYLYLFDLRDKPQLWLYFRD
jgi:hypothetical protein